MKFLWIALFAGLVLMQTGCETFGRKPTKGEIFVRKVSLDGLKLGDTEKQMLKIFPKAKLRPFGRPDRRVFEIDNPNPSISLAVAYFIEGKLFKLEFRYFNGPGVQTLTNAGGWDGLRDYMITRFGPPTRVGLEVPIQTEAGDLEPKYANFNGEWTFPKQQRLVQYIAFSGPKGGIGVVTLVDCAPFAASQQRTGMVGGPSTAQNRSAGQAPVRAPNPGF